jgi:hypothetical protein
LERNVYGNLIVRARLGDPQELPNAFWEKGFWEEDSIIKTSCNIYIGEMETPLRDMMRIRLEHGEAFMELGITKDVMRMTKDRLRRPMSGNLSTPEIEIRGRLKEPICKIRITKHCEKSVECLHTFYLK